MLQFWGGACTPVFALFNFTENGLGFLSSFRPALFPSRCITSPLCWKLCYLDVATSVSPLYSSSYTYSLYSDCLLGIHHRLIFRYIHSEAVNFTHSNFKYLHTSCFSLYLFLFHIFLVSVLASFNIFFLYLPKPCLPIFISRWSVRIFFSYLTCFSGYFGYDSNSSLTSRNTWYPQHLVTYLVSFTRWLFWSKLWL